LISASQTFEESSKYFIFIQVIVAVVLCSHWLACVWFIIIVPNDGDFSRLVQFAPTLSSATAADRYFFALQQALSMLWGNAPVPPQTWTESLFNFSCMLLGSLLNACIICLIGTQIATTKSSFALYRQQMDEVQDEMFSLGMSDDLIFRVEKYYKYLWQNRRSLGISQFVRDENMRSGVLLI
jgi:hypothetical protein